MNLFVGDNGHGKTNILEALQFFKFGRSFRTARDNEVIKFNEPFSRLEVTVEYFNGDMEIFAASIERDGTKHIKINNNDVPKLSSLVGQYPSVLFGPQDLTLVSGGPVERRRYLDMTGSMTDKAYLEGLRAYRRVLSQRNAALKKGTTGRSRRVWDEELVRTGCELIEKRSNLVEDIASYVTEHIETLHAEFPVEIDYESRLAGPFPRGVSRGRKFCRQTCGCGRGRVAATNHACWTAPR